MAPDHLKKVIVVGASGNSGTAILRSLIAADKFELTVLSRPESKASFPENVTVKRASYGSGSYDILAVQRAFEGQDAAVMCLSFNATDDQPRLLEAAVKAGIEWIVPNEYAGDGFNDQMLAKSPAFQPKQKARKQIEQLGAKWIGICTGPWIDTALKPPYDLGINISGKKIETWDKPGRITMSTLPQVGRAVAAVLSLPIEDKEKRLKSLDHYANNFVYVQSFTATQEDVFAAVQRASSTTPNDWEMKVHKFGRLDKAVELKQSRAGAHKWYLDSIMGAYMQDGEGGDVEQSAKEDMEVLGVPLEDLDEVVTRLVKDVQ